MIPVAASMPNAIGKSKPVPSFFLVVPDLGELDIFKHYLL